MKRQVLAAVVALGAVFSAGDAVADPDTTAVYDFSGPYIGAHAGYGQGNARTDVLLPLNFWTVITGDNTGSFDTDGFLGGGQFGYLFQQGNFVFGIDASLSGTDMDDEIVSPGFPALDRWSTELDFLLLLQGRLGYAMDNWLFFAQGGFAGAQAEAKLIDTGGTPFNSADGNWHNGWTVGAGILYKFNETFSLGAEYNYVSLSKERYKFTAQTFAPTPAEIDHDLHIFKITGNIHFGQLFGGM